MLRKKLCTKLVLFTKKGTNLFVCVMKMAPESCIVLSYYSASSGNSLPTFRTTLKTIEMGQIVCPETSAMNYRCSLSNSTEKRNYRLLRSGSLQSH